MAFVSIDEMYNTNRRRGCSVKNKRKGPVLVDDITNLKEIKALGNLSIQYNPSNDYENGGLAGSNELLAYFHRLSGSDQETRNELIDVQYITALLNAGADINVADRFGQTILHAAARDWHPDVARFLIEHNADVNKQDSFGRSPIFIAAALDYPEMVEFLASRGADINMRTFGEKQTPLHYAAKNEAIGSIKRLLKLGADLSAKDYKGRVPLYIAVLHGCEAAAQYLLDIGCPVAVFDRNGVSAVALMVEKMPSIAHKALFQFMSVDKTSGMKAFYLGSLESTESRVQDKTVLELIVKYNELDLLCHPVIQRLMKLRWQKFGFRYALVYLLINIFYVLLWTLLAIIAATKNPFSFQAGNYWKIALAVFGVILTIVFVFEQTYRIRVTHISEQAWKTRRITSLTEDLRFCHPQWPHEREATQAQIDAYNDMVGDHVKNVWNYLEWMTAVAIVLLLCIRVANYFYEQKLVRFAFHVTMTFVVFLVWLRFLKACKAFKTCGQFIAVIGNVLIAVGQFAFLFMIFFVPFVVTFWIFFGGEENAQIIAKKVSPRQSNAFRKLNDAVYSVWTLTLVVGFPMSAIKAIDQRISEIYVSLYYFVMSVVCLNLFIALLSQVFAQVYSAAFKYAMLEQAKSIMAGETLLSARERKRTQQIIKEKCNPLIERIGFRENHNEQEESDYMIFKKVKREAQRLIAYFDRRNNKSTTQDEKFLIKKIANEFSIVERNQDEYERAIATLHKLKVENRKILKLLGLKTKH